MSLLPLLVEKCKPEKEPTKPDTMANGMAELAHEKRLIAKRIL